tara:strand:- start:223 stop:333 length:111 start_codon:yes stop_codon:yes gene_type:complete
MHIRCKEKEIIETYQLETKESNWWCSKNLLKGDLNG